MSFKLLGRDESGQKIQVDQFLVGSWNKLSDTVPALASKNIDSVDLADFNSLDYIITIFNDTENVARRFQVSAIREGGTIKDEIFGRMGSLSNILVNVDTSGSVANIEIVNNNSYELSVSFAKLLL